eukprot:c8124_g1_i1.p1 GENE.c8124_g1_i1~~c8124_g1_i1.p1  ORF type:complete len:493 (+),score=127.15 c8124_g1_i1:44-1480(+)
MGRKLLLLVLLSFACYAVNVLGAFTHKKHQSHQHRAQHKAQHRALEPFDVSQIESVNYQMTKVVFFRHGQSEWNVAYEGAIKKLTNYWSSKERKFWDTPLSPKGILDGLYICRLLIETQLTKGVSKALITEMLKMMIASGISLAEGQRVLELILEVKPSLDDLAPTEAMQELADHIFDPSNKPFVVFTSNLHRALDTGILAMLPALASRPQLKIRVNSDWQETDANGDCEATYGPQAIIRKLAMDTTQKDTSYGDQEALYAEVGAGKGSSLFALVNKLYEREDASLNLGNNPIADSVNSNDGIMYAHRDPLSSKGFMKLKGFVSGEHVVGNFGKRVLFTAPPSGARQVDLMSGLRALHEGEDTMNVVFGHSRYFRDLLKNFAAFTTEDEISIMSQVMVMALNDETISEYERSQFMDLFEHNLASSCNSPKFNRKIKPGSGVRFDLLRFVYHTKAAQSFEVFFMVNCKFVIASKGDGEE